ncbi:sulfurtransferase [Spirochaeta dissipatitropha]
MVSVTGSSILLSPQRLYQALDEVKVIDVRDHSDFESGHIPGAVNIPVDRFEQDVSLGEGIVPRQVRDHSWCVAVLSEHGIQRHDTLVLYDQGGSCRAARLWWILARLGHERAAILNGGFSAWVSDISRVQRFSEAPQPAAYEDRAMNLYHADFSDVLTAQSNKTSILCNTLPAESFAQGSIPRSINLPYTLLFTGRPVPTIRRSFEAEAVFAQAGIALDSHCIFFGSSSYASSLAFFSARLCGMHDIALYDGSLRDWFLRGGLLH